jgi:hypothetical protein
VGRRSREGEAFFHQQRSLVECRVVLPEEVWNAKPDGVSEQDPLGSDQAEVGYVALSCVAIRAQLSDSFRLPELADELQSMLKESEGRLRKLPKPPSANPVGEIIEMVSGFSRSLSNYVQGTPGKQGIHQIIRGLHMKFKDAIQETAPDFRPYKSGESLRYEPPIFLATEKTELGSEDRAICVDEVMDMALQ